MCSSRQTRGGATLRGRVTPKQRKRGSDIRARTCTRLRLYCTCVSSRSFTEARRESASRTAPTKPLDRSVGGRRAVRSSCFAAGEADAAGRRNRCPAPAPNGRVRLLLVGAARQRRIDVVPWRKLTGSAGSRRPARCLAWRGAQVQGSAGSARSAPTHSYATKVKHPRAECALL